MDVLYSKSFLLVLLFWSEVAAYTLGIYFPLRTLSLCLFYMVSLVYIYIYFCIILFIMKIVIKGHFYRAHIKFQCYFSYL